MGNKDTSSLAHTTYATHQIRCGDSAINSKDISPDNFDIQQYLLTLDRKGLKALLDQVSNALFEA